jgi:hypothetical protein
MSWPAELELQHVGGQLIVRLHVAGSRMGVRIAAQGRQKAIGGSIHGQGIAANDGVFDLHAIDLEEGP